MDADSIYLQPLHNILMDPRPLLRLSRYSTLISGRIALAFINTQNGFNLRTIFITLIVRLPRRMIAIITQLKTVCSCAAVWYDETPSGVLVNYNAISEDFNNHHSRFQTRWSAKCTALGNVWDQATINAPSVQWDMPLLECQEREK